MTAVIATPASGAQKTSANSRYLTAHLSRLRVLFRRRVLWLRKRWGRDARQSYIGWAISDHEADLLLAGNERREELDFYAADAEARLLGARLAEASAEVSMHRRTIEESGIQPALDVLVERFRLTPFERDVLLLCLAVELDPAFERICAYAQDDATRKCATPNLALSLLADADSSGIERAALCPGGALRRWRLVIVEGASAHGAMAGCALRLDERVVDYLLGIDELDRRCHGLVRPAPAIALPKNQHDLVARLARGLTAGGMLDPPTLINLIGEPDNGAIAIAREVSSEAGLNLLMLDPRALHPSNPEHSELSALLEREAVLLGLAYYVDLDSLKADEAAPLLAELDRFAAPLIIAGRERVRCEREALVVQVARPDASAQVEMWRLALGRSCGALNGEVEAIVEQFDFGPLGIGRTVAQAASAAALRSAGGAEIRSDDLWEACRRQSVPQLEQLAQNVVPCYDWEDIVVPAEVLGQLREITTQVAHRHQVYQDWGFGRKLSRGRGISALFSGVSGVGKTMAAEVMARHLKLDLYRIDLAGVVSKYIGQTEKNLRSVFDAAERSGAILFFDEADALFGKRSEVKDSHDRYANIEVNYLLQRMEDYRGLAILATNMKSALDPAFMRRLRFIVDFPFPDAIQRSEIWRRVFPSAAAVRSLDFGALSRLEIPGGNIRNVAVNAAFMAAGEGMAIDMEHVMKAARREYAKIDRLIMDAEFGRFAATRMQ